MGAEDPLNVTDLEENDRVRLSRGEKDLGEFTVRFVRESSWNGTTSAFVLDEDGEQHRLYNTDGGPLSSPALHLWRGGVVSGERV